MPNLWIRFEQRLSEMEMLELSLRVTRTKTREHRADLLRAFHD